MRKRLKRRFLLDNLEPRIVLAGVPQEILLDTEIDAFPVDFTEVDGVVYFTAESENEGRELWRTDGTQAGTSLVKDISPGFESSYPQSLTAHDGRLFFTADNGINGRELWVSDGTESGTVLVRDIVPDGFAGYGYDPAPTNLVSANGRLFFSADDGTNGAELWMSDGTQSGTMMVSNIMPTPGYGSYPRDLTPFQNRLFFAAGDDIAGEELWVSDGTESGTILFADLNPNSGYYGPLSSSPSQFTEVDGELFFSATGVDGNELWRTDGTESGTMQVRDILPGTYDGYYGTYGYSSNPSNLTAVAGQLFFSAIDENLGQELWVSDGTEAGTFVVADIASDVNDGILQSEFVAVGDRVFFRANDLDTGEELWVSDGTEEGTMLVRDIEPGFAGSYPTYLTELNGRVFFTAETSDEGIELWESDGTESGTQIVADLAPGDDGSFASELFNFNGSLLMSADNGSNNTQLWTVGINEATARVMIFVDGEPVAIPANVGVNAEGQPLAQGHTLAENVITVAPIDDEALQNVTLGDFFTTWRTNGGQAGNNAAAAFGSDRLMASRTDAENTVQMFVNGVASTEFDNYVIQNNDEITLIYSSNPVVSLNTNFGPILIELFEEETPLTVDNFLNYVNDGDYENTIFHRSIPGFVIQGGGFETTSSTFTDVSQLERIAQDPTVQNEPGISNLRGTVAMAKLGGDPNSATNQFFVNLGNNSSNLDNQNGGFTVFGEVLDLTTSDEIAAIPTSNLDGGTFTDTPLDANNQLVTVSTVEGSGFISGERFVDTNNNGIRDAGEEALPVFEIFDDANNNGALDDGETSTLADADGMYKLALTPGRHTIRIVRAEGSALTLPSGMDHYVVDVEIGQTVTGIDFGEGSLVPPASVQLVAFSDTGRSNSDTVINLNNSDSDQIIQFDVANVAAGAQVNLYSDGQLIGSGIGNGGTVRISTDGATSLGDGIRSITATQVIDGMESGPSSSLAVTVDTAVPAAFTNTLPDFPEINQLYTADLDSSEEGTPDVTYVLNESPTGMTIDSATGVVRWTPNSDQAVPTTVTVAIVDLAGNEQTLSTELTVLGAISAFPDVFTVAEDETLTVTSTTGVLSNDGNNTDTLTASVVDQPENGMLSFNADGSFNYTPNADFFGTDSFTYQATDGNDDSNVARATINVTDVNDLVTTVDDSYTTEEDMELTVNAATGVLANDVDPDSSDLTATIIDQPENGSVSLNTDGSFTYTPNAEFSGTDSFTYVANDGISDSSPATVSINVTLVEDPPTATEDSYTVDEDSVLTINVGLGVLANDNDPDSDTITAAVDNEPSNGTLNLNEDGSFTYEPNENFFGTDTFTYVASDGAMTSQPTDVTITVTAQVDPPTAQDDEFDAPNDGSSVSLDVLANDSSDPDDPQELTIQSVTQSANGATVEIDGSMINYTSPSGFAGSDTFTYTIVDTDGLTSTATVTVDILDSGSSSISGVVYLDSDGDGQRDDGESGVPGVQVTLTGTDVFGESVSRSYITSNRGNYRFTDLTAGTYRVTETQPMALVDGEESTPQAGVTTNDDTFENIELASNQSLSDNNFGEASLRPEYYSIVWFFASSGSPEAAFREIVAMGEDHAGNASLAQQIRSGVTEIDMDTDPDGGNNEPDPPPTMNTDPVAVADSYEVANDETLSVNASNGVLSNDTDADNDSLSVTLTTEPTNGTVTLSANGSFTYVPDGGFSGQDTFTYTVDDGNNGQSTAVVTIDVMGVPNNFRIDENSDNGTVVGNVEAVGASGELAYELQDQNDINQLDLRPDDHISGNPAAPVVLIEYLDFQCPVCASFHPTITALENEFRNEEALLVVRRHFPLEDIHPNAQAAARAAEAAGRQEMFEAMGDLLFDNRDDWIREDDPQSFFDQYAMELGLDMNQFASDIADPDLQDRINRDRDIARDELDDAEGTPTFYINGEFFRNPSDPNDVNAFEVAVQNARREVEANQVFSLNRETGEIRVVDSSALDFERQSVFTLPIVATAADGTQTLFDVTINLSDVNEAIPVATDDSYSVAEDTVLTVTEDSGLLQNDRDDDGEMLTAQLTSSPDNGVLTFNANGSFIYDPNDDFNGTDTFTYLVNDSNESSEEATVTITVNPVNDAPIASDDSYDLVGGNAPLTIEAVDGVILNDTDIDADDLIASVRMNPARGQVTLNADGSFSYAPDSGFVGTDSFTYVVSDGTLESDPATVSITVTAHNELPVANDDAYSLGGVSSLIIGASSGILANDTDAEDDPLIATLVSGPSDGQLQLSDDGSFQYAPDNGFVGQDSFTYRANDGVSDSNLATVVLTVTTGNDAPTAVDDEFRFLVDQPLTIPADAGVLINDLDPDTNEVLTAAIVSNAQNGTVTLDSDGAFTYVPNSGFSGTDSFTYRADDGEATSNEATVTISRNELPTVVNDSYVLDVDTPLIVNADSGVLSNDSDADGDDLTATVFMDPDSGTLELQEDGSFTFVPESGFVGEVTFSYLAQDGFFNSEEATVQLTVAASNSAPTGEDDQYDVFVNGQLSVDAANGVLSNDSDPESDPIIAELTDDADDGTVSLNEDGSFTYIPNTGFHGFDLFRYVVSDSRLESNEITVAITVNTPPTVEEDAFETEEGTTLTVEFADGVLENDFDGDGDALTVQLVMDVSDGDLSLASNGSFSYVPDEGFIGIDSFTYTASDGFITSDPVTVTISVNSINISPIAQDDNLTINEDGSVFLNPETLLANDTDENGDPLALFFIEGPANGTLTEVLVYMPNPDFHGTDTIRYVANDGQVDSEPAVVTIEILPVNDAPVANDDNYDLVGNGNLVVDAESGLLSNDADVEDDPLTVTVINPTQNGSLVMSPDGSFEYSPAAGFVGTDTFTYQADDGTVTSNTATVTLIVDSLQIAPVADSYDTDEDTALVIDAGSGILANDTLSGMTVPSLVQDVANGMLTLNMDGSFSYTPNDNFHGVDSFSYTLNNGGPDTNAVMVTITVAPVNDLPVANDDEFEVQAGESLAISMADLVDNDSDVDGDALTIIQTSDPQNGSTALMDGEIVYTPNPDFVGTDSFLYVANDGTGDSNAAMISIEVQPVNAPPMLQPDSYMVDEDHLLIASGDQGILANDTFEGSFTASVVQAPSNGTLTLSPNGWFDYFPNGNFHGTDSFTYTISDGVQTSSPETVTIVVNPVNDRPIAVDDEFETTGGASVTIELADLLQNDSDIEGDNLGVARTTDPANGVLEFNGGAWTYTPNVGFDGSDSFTYVLNDGTDDSNEATVVIVVQPAVADVTLEPDSYSVDEDHLLIASGDRGVLANDTFEGAYTAAVVQDTSNGTLTFSANGWFDYFPNENFHGTDSFTYSISDGVRTSAEETVTIVVNSVNDRPTVVDDEFESVDGASVTIGLADLLQNDFDVDGDNLAILETTDPSHGVLEFDGVWTYTPNADFEGVDTFTYVANDGTDDSRPATVSITVSITPSPVVAENDVYATPIDVPLTIDVETGVLSNDSAGDNILTATIVRPPTSGSLSLNIDGSFEFTPARGFHGATTFTYTASDSVNVSDEATVLLLVNDVTIVVDDEYGLEEDLTLIGSSFIGTDVLANDVNPDGDALAVRLAQGPANGSVTLETDGSFAYSPNADYHGTDSFTYVVNDGFADSAEATVTIEIRPINDRPLAQDDSFMVETNGSLGLAFAQLLANDSDVDGDDLELSIESQPANGTLSGDGPILYTPNPDFTGTDSFTYVVSDGIRTSRVATVSLIVADAANQPPVAVADSHSVDQDTILAVDAQNGVLANDSDAENDPLTAVLVESTVNGMLTLSSDGSFIYIPNAGSFGADSFIYKANDGSDSNEVVVTINVLSSPEDDPLTTSLAATADVTLYESANGELANGSGSYLFTGVNGNEEIRRALVQFDLSATDIPSNATIRTAALQMSLSRTSVGPQQVGIHQVETAWTEGPSDAPNSEGGGTDSETGDATWIHTSFDTALWNNAGGDFDATPSAMTEVDQNGFYFWSSPQLANDVQEWLDDPSTNFGWAIVGDETGASSKRFDSREFAILAQRPMLFIEYTINDGQSNTFIPAVAAGNQSLSSSTVDRIFHRDENWLF